MSGLRGLTPHQRDQILEEAAREHALLTLAVRQTRDWKTYKARLLEARRQPPSLVVEYPATAPGEAAPEIDEGQLMGVGFRRGQRKCLFTAMVIAMECPQPGIPSSVGSAVLRWPEEMQELQRRAYERVDVPSDWGIDVEFWPAEVRPSPRRKSPPSLLTGRLVNLSAGGLAVSVTERAAQNVKVEGTYACLFAPEKHHPPFSVQAILRHRAGVDETGHIRLGFQFLGLEFNPRTLSRLARVVSQFHRFSPNQARPH